MATANLSTCSVETCQKPRDGKLYCGMHSKRAKATGDPLRPCANCGKDIVGGYGPKLYCSDACRPICAAPKCVRPVVGRAEHCQPHQSSIYKRGRLPEYTWAAEKKCIVCGREHDHPRFRKVCSNRCGQLLSRNGGVVPQAFKQCARCTTIIDLSVPTDGGRKRKSDIKVCDACRRAKYTRHRMSVTQLADRDGTDCGICGDAVDMTLLYPDMLRASVDHVLPYASGGTHDPENLQLSHLRCNLIKQNRPGFVM